MTFQSLKRKSDEILFNGSDNIDMSDQIDHVNKYYLTEIETFERNILSKTELIMKMHESYLMEMMIPFQNKINILEADSNRKNAEIIILKNNLLSLEKRFYELKEHIEEMQTEIIKINNARASEQNASNNGYRYIS